MYQDRIHTSLVGVMEKNNIQDPDLIQDLDTVSELQNPKRILGMLVLTISFRISLYYLLKNRSSYPRRQKEARSSLQPCSWLSPPEGSSTFAAAFLSEESLKHNMLGLFHVYNNAFSLLKQKLRFHRTTYPDSDRAGPLY